jgi:hypothetical protein
MLKERSRFVPKAETWLWDVLDPKADVPVAWLRERFVHVAKALPSGAFSRDAAIVPKSGENSRLASVEIDGGRDAKFVVVYVRDVTSNWQPGFQETLTYRRDVAGTDLIYDLTGEFMQGSAPFRPISGCRCGLRRAAVSDGADRPGSAAAGADCRRKQGWR